MRTRFEIVIADEGDPALLRAAAEEALDEVERTEVELSAYRRDGGFFELNTQAAEGPVKVTATLFRFLETAREMCERTHGAVDITVGALVALYREGAPAEAISDARRLVGFDHLQLDGDAYTARFVEPGVRLDPGALGKGWALGRAADLLQEAGVRAALLHGGTSSVVALGSPPGLPAWTVALEHPAQPGRHVARVQLRDRSLSVSTIFGRTHARDERVVGHVLDPRTGEPVAHTWLAAATSEDATHAEALSTALLVEGEAALPTLLPRFAGAQALLAVPAGEDVRVLSVGGDFVVS